MDTSQFVETNQERILEILRESGVSIQAIKGDLSDLASPQNREAMIRARTTMSETFADEIKEEGQGPTVAGPIVCTFACAALCGVLCGVTAAIGLAPAAAAGETAAFASDCAAICALSALVATAVAAGFI
jgi:hypothetical protein